MFFGDVADSKPQPPATAGAAMNALIRMDLLPSFALSFHSELARAADPQQTPARLAWIGEDVLLLAPYQRQGDERHWHGFLIAEATAAGQRRLLQSEDGEQLWVEVPAAVATKGAVMAAEDWSLPIV